MYVLHSVSIFYVIRELEQLFIQSLNWKGREKMTFIWNRINNTSFEEKTKQTLFLILNVILCSVIGAAAWLVLGHVFLSNIAGLIEFIGYAAFFGGIFGGLIFLYRQ